VICRTDGDGCVVDLTKTPRYVEGGFFYRVKRLFMGMIYHVDLLSRAIVTLFPNGILTLYFFHLLVQFLADLPPSTPQ